MKLVLTSNSITTPTIANKVVELVGKSAEEIKIAVINEAYAYEFGSHQWLLNNLDAIRKYFGDFNIEFVNLLALDLQKVEERIAGADVVFCCGGNAEYLQTVFEKTGFNKVMQKILKTKVFVGISAGSIIVGKLPTFETLNRLYGVTDLLGIKDYLKIFNFSILPHTGMREMGNRFFYCMEESKKQDYPVYCLSNYSAVVIDGDREYLIGEDCCKLLNGKIIDKID